ncbi:LuxR C-terminal-related transcriptional regulator [Kitasatospora sp. NPDC088548]|uniref:LuxR C-terminal-related transcriptional regulator n=1 Tax=Kitasatospora sp. NPDC088548 TaxID=3364075 RepID=UPI00382DCAE1
MVTVSIKPGPTQELDQYLDDLRAHARALLNQTDALPDRVQELACSSWPDDTAVEHLVGMDYINRRIAGYLDQAKVSLRSAQPAPRDVRVRRGSYERDLPLLARGVAVHTIYPDSQRLHEPTARWVATMTESGAEVRTLPGPFQQVIIIDSRAAFIPSASAPQTDQPKAHAEATLVKDPAVVRFLVEEYEARWSAAAKWHPAPVSTEVSSLVPLAPVQSIILQLLAVGRSQDAIARELDLSIRTVSKHLAAIRNIYGVDSVSALMYEYGMECAAKRNPDAQQS